jgi:hypothetical protein
MAISLRLATSNLRWRGGEEIDLGVGTFELISSGQMKLQSGGTGNLGIMAMARITGNENEGPFVANQ